MKYRLISFALLLGLVCAGRAHTQAPPAELTIQAQPLEVDEISGIATVPPQLMTPMPSWFKGGRPTQDADIALATLAQAETQGLNPQDYRVVYLTQGFESARRDGADTAALDQDLTAALQHYLSDLIHGRLSPEVLRHRFKAPALQPFDARTYIAQARHEGRLQQALQAAQPRVPMYAAIRAAMNIYRGLADHPAWHQALPPLPGRSLKPGDDYEGLPLLAQRLAVLGDLPPAATTSNTYQPILVEAVQRFQARHGLDVDGVLGPATIAQLEVSPAQRLEQMGLTLERLRWTPLLYGPRMIVVNVPEFVLRAYESTPEGIKLELEMRVIVGRALDTRTPIFLEDMRFIEFNPYWNVPRSIARGETLPRLRRDPAYFQRQGYEFVTNNGRVVTSLSESAIEAVQKGQWRIRQRPGPRNAMGDIKFIMPNDQNIYLHHTPAPQLFERSRRDFSHGCIRIESPVALAQFVLGKQAQWSPERISEAMESGRSRTIKLSETIPVLIAYSTVVVKDDGTVYFFPDIYQQDEHLKQALLKARQVN